MISVRYGFDNSIDPSIISHPANCKLMRHRDNKRKHTNISMSKEELIEKVLAHQLAKSTLGKAKSDATKPIKNKQ